MEDSQPSPWQLRTPTSTWNLGTTLHRRHLICLPRNDRLGCLSSNICFYFIIALFLKVAAAAKSRFSLLLQPEVKLYPRSVLSLWLSGLKPKCQMTDDVPALGTKTVSGFCSLTLICFFIFCVVCCSISHRYFVWDFATLVPLYSMFVWVTWPDWSFIMETIASLPTCLYFIDSNRSTRLESKLSSQLCRWD